MDLNYLEKKLEYYSASTIEALGEGGEIRKISFRKLLTQVRKRKDILHTIGTMRKTDTPIGIVGGNSIDIIAWDLACIICKEPNIYFSEEQIHSGVDNLIRQNKLEFLIYCTKEKYNGSLRLYSDGEWGYIVHNYTLQKCSNEWQRSNDILSYVFSSGATGNLKGLIISKSGTEHLSRLFIDYYNIDNKDKTIIYLPLSNFQQRICLFAAIYNGLSLVLTDPLNLFKAVKEMGVSFFISPPVIIDSMLQMVVAKKKQTGGIYDSTLVRSLFGDSLRFIVTGMAPVNPDTLCFFNDLELPIFEAFASTETGLIAANNASNNKVGTLGKPISEDLIYISEAGELRIKPDHKLTIQYFRSTEEDAKKTFLDDGSIATGDLVTLDKDGYLIFEGRTGNTIMTKSGEKYNPEPIEARIRETIRKQVRNIVYLHDYKRSTNVVVVAIPDNLSNDDVKAMEASVKFVNKDLREIEKVHTVTVINDEFRTDNNLLTRNMKANRQAIFEKYVR